MAREPHRSSEILDAVALLVVDMQDAFLNVMPDREAVLRRTALAIEAARAFGIKVIFTEQVPAKLGPTNAELLALAPEARVFAKNEFSALLAEGLQDYLRRINVYHLLLAGIETPICIYQTALHAQDNELDVTLLSDCTTGRRPEDCVIVLEALARAECHVLPAETVFYSMLGSSMNPRFPHFTRIVKRYSGEGPIDGVPTPAPDVEARQESEGRGDGGRHGDRRGGRGDRSDRQHGGRRDDRQAQRRGGQTSSEPVEDEIDEPTSDLAAEDGISEAEANQPSYEDITAEHSAVEPVAEAAEAPDTDRPVSAQPAPEEDAAADAEGAEDESGEADDAEGDTSSAEGADGAPRKKRGRRRRGGARRRRARERAAAAASGHPASENTDSPAAPGGDQAAGDSSPAEPRDGGAPTPTPDGPPVP